MKRTKRFTAILLVALVALLTATLTACNKNKQNHDPEERPFTMSISTPDGVFNPFFSTSGYDSSIISMTQIGLISTDPQGKPIANESEPCVAKAFTVTEATDKSSTTYEFLIKKGIKFSDGHDLTIRDVLFNLYVYLDPVYTGSATIYSTDIKGLQAYRTQQTEIDPNDPDGSSVEAGFVTKANQKVDKIVATVQTHGTGIDPSDRPTGNFSIDDIVDDFAYVAKTFYEELTSDWNAIDLIGGGYDKWGFTEKWQVFFMNDNSESGFLKREFGEKHDSGPLVKDKDGNYQLNEIYSQEAYELRILPHLIEKGLANNEGEIIGSAEDVEKAIKDYSIKSVFHGQFTDNFPIEVVERKESKITLSNEEKNAVKESIQAINANDFETIIRFWGTANKVLDKFKADAKTEYFSDDDHRLVKSISGITTHKTSSFDGKQLDGEYDVLRIEINGVDPKAIYNFGFIVAPKHYYSGIWNGHNYVDDYDPENGKFGVEFANANFMNEVVNESSYKIKLPLGAGPYMASSINGGAGTADTFFNLNVVYYERNPYFYTTGENIENAKIKIVRYKVVESDGIINSLISGNIDFGDPSAKKENEDLLNNNGLITQKPWTNGYGYVGINPRFVPDVEVRRAIIKALNVQRLKHDYYKGDFCDIIYRPMTKESWAYPTSATVYESLPSSSPYAIGAINSVTYALDNTGEEIEELVESAGYVKENGVYQRRIQGFGVHKLDYKFTIAGGSTDHPAYKLFLDAADLLNAHGFDVKVTPSQQALSDLSAGKLAVWAAAWSSTIDPDMFQVYHKDSQASSVKNWGYTQILGGTNAEAWGDELIVVEQLSKVIDDARHTTVEALRKNLYKDALDLVMELAVECPTYQRKDLFAYQNNLLNPDTLPKQVTSYSGLLARIWEINYL